MKTVSRDMDRFTAYLELALARDMVREHDKRASRAVIYCMAQQVTLKHASEARSIGNYNDAVSLATCAQYFLTRAQNIAERPNQ